MHYWSLETAPKIAGQIDLAGSKTLLDLGGDSGTYAMTFLAKNPRLLATACDRPEALEVVREIVGTHNAGAQLFFAI